MGPTIATQHLPVIQPVCIPALAPAGPLNINHLVDIGLQAVTDLHLDPSYHHLEDVIVNTLLNQVVTSPICTILHIPRGIRPLWAQVLSHELNLAHSGSIWGAIRLMMLAKCTLRLPPRGGKKRRFSLTFCIKEKLLRWHDNDIAHLWSEASREAKPSTQHLSSPETFNTKRALFHAKEGQYGKAIRQLQSKGVASPDNPQALQDLIKRHPQCPIPDVPNDLPPPLVVSPEQVKATLVTFPKGSSPGYTMLRAQHLLDATCGTPVPAALECLMELTRWLNSLLSGTAHPLLAPWLCGASLTALVKKNNDGFRPIAVGDTFRRLASRLCCASLKPSLPAFFIPRNQLGVGIPGGLEAAIHSTRLSITQLAHRTDMCLLKVDFTNAFNECSRLTSLEEVSIHFPDVAAWSHWSYCVPAELRFGHHHLTSTSGVQQGDPLGPLLFSLVLAKLTSSLPQSPSQVWYLDDGTIIGPRDEVKEIYDHLSTHGTQYGLILNPAKCEVYWPSGDQSFSEFPPTITRLRDGVSLLGSPVYGSKSFASNTVLHQVQQIGLLQSSITELNDPQIELHLLRSCLSVCKVNHLLRTVPLSDMSDPLLIFDVNLRATLSKIIHGSVPGPSWTQATLPLRLGGLGLREASPSAHLAFKASCSLSKQLVHDLTSLASAILPGEQAATKHLENLQIHCPPDTLTFQSTLHRALDNQTLTELLSTVNIRDHARLRSISSASECSAWLRAAPVPSLGLAIPDTEFLTCIRHWLGIPIFHSTVICPCSAPIDPFGDHLLGCSHGPYRVRRHNALRDVLFHALKQDHPNVKLEQHFTGHSKTRPGDIFHPEFKDHKPTFFDVTISNTLSPCNIPSSSRAGSAAADAEIRKDGKYLESITIVGGAFIPLSVETLGLWSPYAIRILREIATRTTYKNGLNEKVAFRCLIEQLSTCLWRHNAKCILHHFARLPSDPLWDIPT